MSSWRNSKLYEHLAKKIKLGTSLVASNLHLTLTSFRNESRVLKEVASILSHGIAEMVYILALHEDGLEERETVCDRGLLFRVKLRTRFMPRLVVFQIIKYVEYCLNVVSFSKEKNISMINVHSLALLPCGVALKAISKAKLIYDTHELESEKNGLRGIRKLFAKLLERLFIRYVDQIFVVSESIADDYRDRYCIERPVVVMNSPHYIGAIHSERFRTMFQLGADVRIFLYQGVLSPGRGIEAIIEAFCTRQTNDAVVVFMGYGPLQAQITSTAQRCRLIFFCPAVAPHEVLNYTASADVGLSLIENTCLSYDYCMPNKLFEYLTAGLPVIVSELREMSSFVKKHGVGVVAKGFSADEINTAILELNSLDINVLKDNARISAESSAWPRQEEKMLSAYRRLLL